ncbi:hypothetical protein HN51_007519 [Arachis hypogaea]|uniref:Nucleolin n=2 Tax=Arachis hypogaea TaxID=3818 RepID=A0A445D7R6_ARAHY|nr:uncharacterized protein LOC112801245 isoform X1 [Arachis hypogaea]XP_025699655.1 uncharacterized protein LOC112801245 isoform X1 [Arachis hypogaea]XP_025699656.1 uncharacterized protein LOC112801245 isoform X1 [Arachis hypogaea]XP_025699657.1 uncharacterized protein LOC112801245 isoform X1 [Arachis hypogaea]XP_029154160.1 uncharacterized protein LOC112801245 isoform X1 [Arachis hypogaea]QHO41670.1 uncharacterized protein DS421_5g147780 [Arachis hypogaea]RYR59179.1 hypothetical protein Ahy_
MGWRSRSYTGLFLSVVRIAKSHSVPVSQKSKVFYYSAPGVLKGCFSNGYVMNFQAIRTYARGGRKGYDLFSSRKPGSADFRKAWAKEMDEDNTLWTGSEDETDEEKDSKSHPDKEIRKARQQAKEHADLINADDSDELRSVWSDTDEEKTLWTGDEMDSDDDIPTEAYPNEKSDKYIDKLFEFDEMPKYRTISEMLKAEQEPEELSPGKQARKIAVENALKKLKKGPDGRYTNVWEVMSDLDILIGAFENVVSGPEYAELRQGGPKQLNMQFFKDIRARMRDPNYKFSPELKLRPKSKLVPRKKWQKAQARRRKAQKR